MALAVWGLMLLATVLPAQEYPFVRVGNSPKNVEHLIEDREGRLWMSTHDDVLAFDGLRFFSLRDLGLPPLFAMSLAEDEEGGIVICSIRGVHRYFRGRVEQLVNGLYARDAVAIAPGVLLITGSKTEIPPFAVYELREIGGRWHADQISGWKAGMHLTRDPSGNVLFACPGGWCELSAQAIVRGNARSPATPVIHRTDIEFARVLRDRSGCLWFRSEEAGAFQCPGDRTPVELPASIAGRNAFSGATESADGSIVIGNTDSLAVGRPGSFQIASPTNGLPPEALTCAIQTRDGSVWVGTEGGLYRFPYPFRLMYWKSPLGQHWSFARAGGTVLAGTSAGVARLTKGGEWAPLQGTRGFGSVDSLLPRGDGSVFAGIVANGVAELRRDGTLEALGSVGRGETVGTLARDAVGETWVGGSKLYKLQQTRGDIALVPEELPIVQSGQIFVASDRSGAVWACSSGVVMRRKQGMWQVVARDGIPQGLCRGLAFEPSGDFWVGYSTAFDLIQPGKDGPMVRALSNGRESGGLATWSLGFDTRGWLWRGSGDGMHIADPSLARAGVWLHLNQAGEIPDPDVNHGSFFADSDGSVWWSAATSVVHFLPPPDLIHPARTPDVFLSAFSEAREAPKLADPRGELSSGARLTAHIGSLEFAARDALRVRFRLLPEEKGWREPAALDLDLGNVGWGNHTLQVESRFIMGDWSPAFSRTITVLRPWWFSWQALLLLGHKRTF